MYMYNIIAYAHTCTVLHYVLCTCNLYCIFIIHVGDILYMNVAVNMLKFDGICTYTVVACTYSVHAILKSLHSLPVLDTCTCTCSTATFVMYMVHVTNEALLDRNSCL